jgi:hypothetical protein
MPRPALVWPQAEAFLDFPVSPPLLSHDHRGNPNISQAMPHTNTAQRVYQAR